MKDIKGTPLKVGDTVAFIENANSSPTLSIGKITSIYKKGDSCSVDGHPHVYEHRILKLQAE